MRGSIAVWHDALTDSARGYSPRVEVHINIWKSNRRKNRPKFDLLDIGFRFQEIRSMGTMSISLPFHTEPENIQDLFEAMHSNRTLSAIFNESLSAGEYQEDGNSFTAFDEKRTVQFYVLRCANNERRLLNIEGGDESSSTIMLNDSFFDRMRGRIGDQYLRLRIRVPFDIENGFISNIIPEESAFLSTISTNEVVEFRLNDRRNFSHEMRDRLDGRSDLVKISAVHYLLIRDMNVELTQAHTSFKKMRRLEPGIWAEYLQHEPQIHPENMIIYHWNVNADVGKFVESFTALSTFRSYNRGYLFLYAIIIVGLGAMGSALQALLVLLAQKYGVGSNLEEPFPSIYTNATIIISIGIAVYILVLLGQPEKRRAVRRAIRRIKHFVSRAR